MEVQRHLLLWFDHAHRAVPWRSNSDPYAVLIAEKLLQQTAAREAVVNAYEELLLRYPIPYALAKANIDYLEPIVRPLGFTFRARELIILAEALVENFDGRVPRSLADLLTLQGVGDYIARAVLSFGFGENVPIVDTNVARFLYRRVSLLGRLPSNPARKKSLISMAGALVPPGNSGEWNLAILDVCALICKLSKPLCPACPVQRFCSYGIGRNEPPPGTFPINILLQILADRFVMR